MTLLFCRQDTFLVHSSLPLIFPCLISPNFGSSYCFVPVYAVFSIFKHLICSTHDTFATKKFAPYWTYDMKGQRPRGNSAHQNMENVHMNVSDDSLIIDLNPADIIWTWVQECFVSEKQGEITIYSNSCQTFTGPVKFVPKFSRIYPASNFVLFCSFH